MKDNQDNEDQDLISDKKVNELYNKMTERRSKSLVSKLGEKTLNEFSVLSSKSTRLDGAAKSLNVFTKKSLDKAKTEFGDGREYLKQNVPIAGEKLKEELNKSAKSIRANAPKVGKEAKNSFLDIVERTTGAIVKGRQYGEKSVRLLKEIGKLREAGLITEQEYEAKKQELLRRI